MQNCDCVLFFFCSRIVFCCGRRWKRCRQQLVLTATECNLILFKGDDESLILVLRRRKNKPEGSRLIRKCSCHKSPASCAYHIIGKLVDDTPVGARIFGSMIANGAGRGLDVLCK